MGQSFIGQSLRPALAALALLAVGGCGFAPMYGKAAHSPAATIALSEVAVAPIPGHLGQDFRNELIDRIAGGRSVSDPRYRLEASISTSEFSALVQSDSSISRYTVTTETPFKLIDVASRAVILNESARVITSYDVPTSEYAAITAKKDADERALRQLAAEVALRIGSYLDTHAEVKPAAGAATSPPASPAP